MHELGECFVATGRVGVEGLAQDAVQPRGQVRAVVAGGHVPELADVRGAKHVEQELVDRRRFVATAFGNAALFGLRLLGALRNVAFVLRDAGLPRKADRADQQR